MRRCYDNMKHFNFKHYLILFYEMLKAYIKLEKRHNTKLLHNPNCIKYRH